MLGSERELSKRTKTWELAPVSGVKGGQTDRWQGRARWGAGALLLLVQVQCTGQPWR